MVYHHLGQSERYAPSLQHALRAAVAASLGRVPVESLRTTIAALDIERAAAVRNLLHEAA